MAQTESMSVVTLDPVSNKMDVKDSNSGKKMKQARLPFMPIDHEQKTLKTITPPGSKKRKLSDNDSPSAKQAKVSAKPVKPLSPNGDAEVSSSSEAEIPPLAGHVKGAKKISTLDRFLFKKRDVQEQEEISSTNDCVPMAIDLTDETENNQVDSAIIKCGNSSATEKTTDDKEAEPSNKHDNDEKTLEEEVKDKTDLENCSNTDPDKEKTKVEEKTEKVVPHSDKENKENIVQDVVCVEDNEEVNQSFVSDTSVCESALKTPAKNNPLVSVLKTPLVEVKKDVSSPVAQSASVTESPGTTSDATPKSGKKKTTKPLSENKMKEREAIRLQKEKEKEEKRLQKEREKEEKEKERLEKKRQKDEEKAEKERQKQEEKDKKEKERLEKLQKKEEEKKKKEEMMEAKTEEKRKKDEERKQKEEEKKLKEEEKQKEEEEKLKKKEKVAQSFKSFFIEKTPVVSPPKTKEGKSQFFMPFEMKPNMRLAPAIRVDSFSEEVRSELDQSLMKQESEDLYLKQLKSKAFRRRKSKKTYPRELTEDKDIEIMCHDEETIKKTLHKVKFLKFAENNRPPYYGTWTKPTTVLSARNPFKQDEALFDYEVDSDDEWEEEDPGESVSSDEEEDDKDKDKDKDEDEEDADGWMVPHGYLSDDEGIDNEDEMDATKKHQLQAARQEAWEREIKMQTQPLKMIAVGCVWEQETLAIAAKQLEKLLSFKAVCLREGPIPTSLSRSEGDTTLSESEKNDEKLATPRPGLKKSVPEEAMPDLIRLLHGNPSGIKKLVKEFRMYWKVKTTPADSTTEPLEDNISSSTDDRSQGQGDGKETPVPVAGDTSMEVDERSETPSTPPNDTSKTESQVDFAISKRQLEIKIPAIAVREKRADNKVTCWYVKDEVLKQYNMEDIQLPNTWEYAHVKAPLWASSNKATPKTDEAAAVKSAPTSGRATPTIGIPNIMQFAQTMSPAQIQAQQAIASPVATKVTIKSVETEAADPKSDTETEELPPVPKDQISIKNFFKLATNGPKPATGQLSDTSKIVEKAGDAVKKAESMGTKSELAKTNSVLASILTGDNAVEKKASEINSGVNTTKNDILKVKPIKRNSAVPLEKAISPPGKMLKVTPISPKVTDARTEKDNDKTQLENKPPAAEPMETDVIVLD